MNQFFFFVLLVNNVGYMRGQNPRVILEIEELVAANDNIKVLQSDARCSDMSKFCSEKYYFFFFQKKKKEVD